MSIPVDLTLSTGVIVTVLLAMIGWLRVRWSALDKRVDDQATRIDSHGDRLTGVEAALRQLPAREDLHRMEVSVTSMAGKMETVAAHLSGQRDIMTRLEAVVSRHEDHLLATKR